MIGSPDIGEIVAGRSPRVAIVVTARSTAHGFVLKTARFLCDKGASVVVLAHDVTSNAPTDLPPDLHLVDLPMSREPSPVQDLKSLRALQRLLKEIAPDAVLYATPKASLLTAVAARFCRIPVRIYQLWGLRLETTSGLRRVGLKVAEWVTAKLSTSTLANSPSLRDAAVALKICSPQEIRVLGHGSSHGVDVRYFHPTAPTPSVPVCVSQFLHKRAGKPVIGFIGRFNQDKGLDTLLSAHRILYATGRDCTLILIGENEGYFTQELTSELADNRNVLLVERVDDPRPYYRAMDVLALPSRREGFPNVVLEAASMAVPAVVTDATGVVDSVVDNRTGYVVPTDDPDALAEALDRLLSNPDLRATFGDRARDRAVHEFSSELLHAELATYLCQELRARHPGRVHS